MIKNIILITQSFPYEGGEQFLETEIQYYSLQKNVRFTILPKRINLKKRFIDNSIKIDNYLINNITIDISNKYFNLLKNLFNIYFFKEFISNNLFNITNLLAYNSSITMYKFYYNAFDEYLKNLKDLDKTIFYTYWNGEDTFALQSLKKKYNFKLISRIHGGDLYQERKINNYMPLKKQFTKNIDKIYTITESANRYLIDTYNFNANILALSRLGVINKKIVSSPNPKNHVHIVSCSYTVEVKQIDKIIQALAILAEQRPEVSYQWTHIGNGKLYDNLVEMSHELLDDLKNIQFHFKGYLNNNEVYKFYETNHVDIFINVSKSEGVPVSIMEAMSCHIPVIAPAIGGITDMVRNGYNGVLLKKQFSIGDIVSALKKEECFKNSEFRDNSYKVFSQKYNAEKNYTQFLNNILDI